MCTDQVMGSEWGQKLRVAAGRGAGAPVRGCHAACPPTPAQGLSAALAVCDLGGWLGLEGPAGPDPDPKLPAGVKPVPVP